MIARKIGLKVLPVPAIGKALDAPPVLRASEQSVDYTCGRCGTVLLHADEGQVSSVYLSAGLGRVGLVLGPLGIVHMKSMKHVRTRRQLLRATAVSAASSL
jgi:hypothetical protein